MESRLHGTGMMVHGRRSNTSSNVRMVRTYRRYAQLAFWSDWAPMIVLGLVIATMGAWRIASSLTPDGHAPGTIVQTQQSSHAPIASSHDRDLAQGVKGQPAS